MTAQGSGRGRKPKPGRITFVGSGPGDPGLLTTRARTVLANAALVFTDPDVPEAVLALAGSELPPPSGPEPAEAPQAHTDGDGHRCRRGCGAAGADLPACVSAQVAPTSGPRWVIRPRSPRRWRPRPAPGSTSCDWWRATRFRWTR